MKPLFLVMLIGLPASTLAQAPAIDLDYARTYFEELRQLGNADGGKLWGVAVAGPMLFADRTTRMVVANMPDLDGILEERNGVWVGTLSADQNVSNSAITWAGREWSMVMWPVSDNRYARGRLLMHESFHRIQDELGLPAVDRAPAHLASAEARIWTRLEWRALTDALLRMDAERKQALEDALVFRARRRMGFKDAAEDERLLEVNEGLAEYTGLVLSGLPRSALADRAAVQLAQYEQQDNFARGFAYASGPAYALLLDEASKSWRSRLKASSDLTELAARAYGINAVDAASAEARVSRYAGARMIADERAREAQRLAAEAKLRARLVDGPTLTLPAMQRFRYSFDPNGAVPMQDIGTAFESSRITDEWGVLDVSSGGVLLRRTGGNVTAAVVAAPDGDQAPLKGEGWTLQLEPGWTIRAGERKGDWTIAPE